MRNWFRWVLARVDDLLTEEVPAEERIPEGNFPKSVTNESGVMFPVSPGGIVRVSNFEDLELIKQPGITVVEWERDLGEDFYQAAAQADEDLVTKIGKVADNFAQFISEGGVASNFVPDICIDNPVLEQVVYDFRTYYDRLIELRKSISSVPRKLDETVQHAERFPSLPASDFPDDIAHLDGSVITALFGYVGQGTDFVDGRITINEARSLMAPYASQRQNPLKDKYEVVSSRLGNLTVIKGKGAVPDLPEDHNKNYSSLDNKVVADIVANLSVHGSPTRMNAEIRGITIVR